MKTEVNEELPLGGMWKQVPPPVVKAQLEEIVLDMLCSLRAVSKAKAPKDFLDGNITASIVSRLSLPLYDQTFAHQINGTISKDYIQFALGEVWTRRHRIENGRADLYIGRSTGQALPTEQMCKIEENLAASAESNCPSLSICSAMLCTDSLHAGPPSNEAPRSSQV